MCPTGLKLYARSDSLLGGLRWRLHTARCPSCAEYRSAERELDAYIAMISETEIRSLRGASARARLTVSPSAAMSDGQQRARRRKITMTRLAYVLTLVIAVALLLGGILYKSPPPDGRSLLIGAAQAMEEVHVIHTRGWNESFRTRPAGAVAFGRSAGAVGSRGSFDHWLSTKGSRYQFFDNDGDLKWSTYTDVEAGLHWTCHPSMRLIWRVPMEVEEAREREAKSMQRYLDGEIMLNENVEQMGLEVIDTRRERRDGIDLYVVEVDTGGGRWEYDIEADTGRLLAHHRYGAPESGRPLVGETLFEYGGVLPEGILEYEVPEGWSVKEAVREEGGELFRGWHPSTWVEHDDPRLLAGKKRLGHANDVRLDAEMGKASWREAEQAYLDVLDPEGLLAYSGPWHDATTILGIMYVRSGRYQDALDILSYPGAMRSWQGLIRAWCFDALGEREEALKIYHKLDQGTQSPALWGMLGLEQPTSPGLLEITAEPGEVLLSPAPGWRASAHRSPEPFSPRGAIDGDRIVRWAANASEEGPGQETGNWFELDFGEPTEVTRIVLDHQGGMRPWASDWPRGIEARFTTNGRTWRGVEVSPPGPMRPATVTFSWPQNVRTIRFELTITHSPEWWSIHEILVFGPSG